MQRLMTKPPQTKILPAARIVQPSFPPQSGREKTERIKRLIETHHRHFELRRTKLNDFADQKRKNKSQCQSCHSVDQTHREKGLGKRQQAKENSRYHIRYPYQCICGLYFVKDAPYGCKCLRNKKAHMTQSSCFSSIPTVSA